MTIKESSITAAVDRVSDPKDKRSLRESVNLLLVEAAGVPSAGSKVAIIDDPTYAVPGVRGTVKGETRSKSGFMDVELENGTVVPCMTSLLIVL